MPRRRKAKTSIDAFNSIDPRTTSNQQGLILTALPIIGCGHTYDIAEQIKLNDPDPAHTVDYIEKWVNKQIINVERQFLTHRPGHTKLGRNGGYMAVVYPGPTPDFFNELLWLRRRDLTETIEFVMRFLTYTERRRDCWEAALNVEEHFVQAEQRRSGIDWWSTILRSLMTLDAPNQAAATLVARRLVSEFLLHYYPKP